MIDRADSELKAWVAGIVQDVDVFVGSPQQWQGKRGVCLYLLALAYPPVSWKHLPVPARVALRYLVTTWGESEEEAHALLGTLVMAVLEKPDYELDLAELPASIWQAFGLAPRPAFLLCMPLLTGQTKPVQPLVRRPLSIQSAQITGLRGIVLGPEDVPIAGAVVTLPSLQLSQKTDARGQFFFTTVPGDTPGLKLLVQARGHAQSLTLATPSEHAEPLKIRFKAFTN